jgi:phosphatidate cytidylyltransferase
MEPTEAGAVVALSLLALFGVYVVLGRRLSAKFDYLTSTLLGSLYIGYFIPHFVLLYRSPDGKRWVFLILLVIMVGDSAGYFVGTFFGKHRLAPQLSPNKTVEGAVGITIAGVVVGLLGGLYLLPGARAAELVALAFIFTILGQLGDLFESMIKRVFSVKDSGSLLPGHGGILDRIDSLVFPAVFTTYYLRLLHI